MKILSILIHSQGPVRDPGRQDFESMARLVHEMKSKGILLDTGGVMDNSLELRYTRSNGKDTVTDGPFTETKEVVGGYALMEVRDREEALEWTRRFLDLVGDATCQLHEVTPPPV